MKVSSLDIVVDGDGSANEIRVRLDPSGTIVEIVFNGVVTDRFPLAAVNSLTINGSDGADTLTVDYSNGDPVPLGSLFFDGGEQSGN